jgi:hypothetical protein
MLLASLTYALTAIILLLGWRFGGGPERLAVIAIFAWVAVDPLYHSIFATPEFGSIDWALAQLPFLFVLLFLLIGISAHRKRVASGIACHDWSR